jgi:hypothetical protein
MLAPQEFVDFFWKVAPGYHCHNSPRGRVLLPEPGSPRVYRPLSDETALFVSFSSLSPTEEAILAFARQYGLLTRGLIPVRSPAVQPKGPEGDARAKAKGDEDSIHGELIQTWKSHIEEMKFAVMFWEALRTNDEQVIRRYLITSSRTWEFRRADSSSAVWFTVAGSDDSDIIEVAWRVLSQLMQQQLSSGIHPMLSYQRSRGRPHLTLEPRDLRSALWLQLSRAIDDDRQ